MDKILGLAISPHPPIIIPEIGEGREKQAQKTINGMDKMAKTVARKKPQTIVVITPHGNLFTDGISILEARELVGDMGDFGRSDIRLKKSVNVDLLEKLSNRFEEMKIPSVFINNSLGQRYNAKLTIDHGAFIPLYYIDKYWDNYEIIHITIGMLSPMELYSIGKVIADTIEDSKYRTIVLASGDMSHRLIDEGPYDYNPMGKVFDDKVVDAISTGDVETIVNMPKNIYEPAGECGLRPFVMALGFFDGYELESEVFSYEGPFGVGYMTAFVDAKGKEKPSLIEKEKKKIENEYQRKRREESPFIALARASIENWVKSGKGMSFDDWKETISDKTWTNYVEENRAGAFVSIHKNDQLRGCIGTIEATQENMAQEIIRNAIQASSSDSRFNPIEQSELIALDIKVDILDEIEPIEGMKQLDIKKYGVIVESGYKRGLLLPNLEGVNSVEEQVSISMRKAGITPGEEYKLYRFQVTRYE